MHRRDFEFELRVLGVEVGEEKRMEGHEKRTKCLHARETTKPRVNLS